MTEANILTQFGIAGLLFVAFMFLLKWVLKTQDKILADAKEERTTWQNVISNYQAAITQISVQSSEFHKQVSDAHTFQRGEHEKIINGLNTVCINAQKHTDVLDQIKENLEEQGQVLLRINGHA